MDSTLLLSPPDEHRKRRYSETISTNQPQDPLPCPRCDSTSTKFCYYNNYNHSQPRHFCKSCRRYWTHGGTLRPVPVGGGTRNSISKPGKRQRVVRHETELENNNSKVSEDVVVEDVGVGPVVDLNEAWWTGLTSEGIFGPEVGFGLGVLDWGVEKSDECCGGVTWPEEDINIK